MYANVVELSNTFHGEIPHVGKACTLVRFKKCNLACHFCDADKIMKTDGLKYETFDDIIFEIIKLLSLSRNLLITGGEPGLYIEDVAEIINSVIRYKKIHVETFQVETNGLFIDKFNQFAELLDDSLKNLIFNYDLLHIVWSPKFNIENEINKNFIRLHELVAKNISRLYIKIVYNESLKKTIEEFINIGKELYGSVFLKKIYLMSMTDENMNLEQLINTDKKTMEVCKNLNVHFSPRIQVYYKIA